MKLDYVIAEFRVNSRLVLCSEKKQKARKSGKKYFNEDKVEKLRIKAKSFDKCRYLGKDTVKFLIIQTVFCPICKEI